VNEVVDESVQIRRLKKELEILKQKQRKSSEGNLSMSSEDRLRFDSEKNELLDRIESLEAEKDNYMVSSSAYDPDCMISSSCLPRYRKYLIAIVR
jgi:hypothetical protein